MGKWIVMCIWRARVLPDFGSDGVLKHRKLKGRRMKTGTLHCVLYRGLRCPTEGYITEI